MKIEIFSVSKRFDGIVKYRQTGEFFLSLFYTLIISDLKELLKNFARKIWR
jgi:hypothetical protein